MGLISRVSSRTYRSSQMAYCYSDTTENTGVCHLYTSKSECFLHILDQSSHQTIVRMFLFKDKYMNAVKEIAFLCKELSITELEIKIMTRQDTAFSCTDHSRFDPDIAISALRTNGMNIAKIEVIQQKQKQKRKVGGPDRNNNKVSKSHRMPAYISLSSNKDGRSKSEARRRKN